MCSKRETSAAKGRFSLVSIVIESGRVDERSGATDGKEVRGFQDGECLIPSGLLRDMTRMQFVRTLTAWRPDLTSYREIEAAYRIALKSLARRYLELHDEIADLRHRR